MRLHPFAGKTYASPNGCNTNSETSKIRKSAVAYTNETYCYSKSYSPGVLSTMSASLKSLQSLNLYYSH